MTAKEYIEQAKLIISSQEAVLEDYNKAIITFDECSEQFKILFDQWLECIKLAKSK